MPKGKANRKQSLLKQGIANLERVCGTKLLQYCCPLCGNFKPDNELTLEHVPPKSMQGKEIILTCFECNSDAGIKIDSQVANQQNMIRLTRSLATQKFSEKERGIVRINDIDLRVELNKESDGQPINIAIIGKANNPKDIEKTKSYLKHRAEASHPLSFNLISESRYNYNEKLAKIGHLKTAFLVATAAFGYSFAFSKSLSKIRQQINIPIESVNTFYIEYFDASSAEKCIIEVPPLGIIVVSFSGVRVVLPHPLKTHTDYENTVRSIVNGSISTIKGYEVSWPENFNACLDNDLRLDFSIVNM